MARRIVLAVALVAGGCAPTATVGRRPPTSTSAPTTSTTSTTLPVTTSTSPPAPQAPVEESSEQAAAPSPPATHQQAGTGAAPSDTLACIRQWETGGGVPGAADYGSRSGPHGGAYQFDQRTWAGAVARAGYPEWSGRPAESAPPEVQDAAAAQLLAERGLQPWPTPSRRCA